MENEEGGPRPTRSSNGDHGLVAVDGHQARCGLGLHEASLAGHEEVRGRGGDGLAGLGGDLDNEYLVVGGVVASPFTMAHGLVNAYYNLHRAVFKNFPSLVIKMPVVVVSVNSVLGAIVAFAMNAVSAASPAGSK